MFFNLLFILTFSSFVYGMEHASIVKSEVQSSKFFILPRAIQEIIVSHDVSPYWPLNIACVCRGFKEMIEKPVTIELRELLQVRRCRFLRLPKSIQEHILSDAINTNQMMGNIKLTCISFRNIVKSPQYAVLKELVRAQYEGPVYQNLEILKEIILAKAKEAQVLTERQQLNLNAIELEHDAYEKKGRPLHTTKWYLQENTIFQERAKAWLNLQTNALLFSYVYTDQQGNLYIKSTNPLSADKIINPIAQIFFDTRRECIFTNV